MPTVKRFRNTAEILQYLDDLESSESEPSESENESDAENNDPEAARQPEEVLLTASRGRSCTRGPCSSTRGRGRSIRGRGRSTRGRGRSTRGRGSSESAERPASCANAADDPTPGTSAPAGSTDTSRGGQPSASGLNGPSWTDAPSRSRDRVPFTGSPGVKIPPASSTDKLQTLQLFLTDEVIQLIVDCTNKYATILLSSPETKAHIEQKKYSRLSKWKPTTVDEMWCFLALVILMGITHKPEYEMYWSKRHTVATPIFGRIMSRDRFWLLRKMIHFADPEGHVPDDPLCRLRPLLDLLGQRFRVVYIPQRDICIDEFLSHWKGRLLFRVYIPAKRERYGVKIFILCESTSAYVFSFIIYTGQSTAFPEPAQDLPDFSTYTQPTRAVLSLLSDLQGKGYCMTTDNWYTSPELSGVLVSLGTDLYGTVRTNRKGLPKDLPVPAKGDVTTKFCDHNMICKWSDGQKKAEKLVNLLSTFHKGKLVETGKMSRSTGAEIKKPDVVLDYNKTMGGVDLLSRNLKPYITQRKGIKWFRKLFELLLDFCIYNSFVVYKRCNPNTKATHLSFRLDVVDDILEKFHTSDIGVKENTGQNSGAVANNPLRLSNEKHFPTTIPPTTKQYPQKPCVRCTRKGRRRDTRYTCRECGVALCLERCFKLYHTKKDFIGTREATPDSDSESD